jgi:hypothetical protein
MFGGLKGHMLQYLTRISVTVSETTSVGIDFFYNDDTRTRQMSPGLPGNRHG